MRIPPAIPQALLFLGAVSLALVGCADEPTSPDVPSALAPHAVKYGDPSGGCGGCTAGNPPPPSAPSIEYALTPSAPDGDDGWYRSDVSLAWTINSNTADTPTYVGCEEPTIADDQPATSYTCSATNSVGPGVPVTVSIKRDKAPPKVTPTGVVDGGTYVEGAVPQPGCSTTDDLSGVATHAQAFSFTLSGGLIGMWNLACHGAKDRAGNTTMLDIQYEITAAPPNNAPTANISSSDTSPEGIPLSLSAAGSSDPDGDALTFAWDLDNDGAYDDATGVSTFTSFEDNGSYTVRLRVTDAKGASVPASKTITVTNTDPRMTFTAPPPVGEGMPIMLTASGFIDVTTDVGSLQVSYSCDGGTTFGATASCPAVDGPATVNVVGRITDKDGGSTSYPKTVSVTNAAPVVASLTLPSAPVPGGSVVSLAATFSDAWANDGHTAAIDWDDASSSAAVSVSTPGSVSATHAYSTPGVYAVKLTVKDDAGAEGTKLHQYVVVYDPSVGFVTGSGWIAYDAAACRVCGGAAGRGDFGFVSKYQKGATVPSGDTRFEFHAGALKFESAAYEWLLVAGKRAQFKGRGTINGTGDYGFLLTAVDDATDAFRIKIWDRATSDIVFDNQMNADDNAPVNTLLNKVSGNGSIVIRTK